MAQGIVGGPRHYDGPTIGEGPWKCPACSAENAGPLDQGCTVCGSGSARPYKVATPPAPINDLELAGFDSRRGTEQGPPRTPRVVGRTDTDQPSPARDIDRVAREWCRAHPDAATEDAFVAGFYFAQQRIMAAPPVTADVPALAPAGRPRRTIIAALELFKDQVLRDAKEEIASGEWLTIEETDALIHQLRDEEDEGETR